MNLLKEAIALAKLGFRVHPLYQPITLDGGPCNCGRPQCERSCGKHPRLEKWQELASAAPKQVHAWWDEWPHSNIGVACGPESNLMVMDVDGEEGLDTLRQLEAEHGGLHTAHVITGSGGYHLYFRWHEDAANCTRLLPGIDIKAAAGQVVGPGSIHRSGGVYEWEADMDPASVDVAEAPAWLMALIRDNRKTSRIQAAEAPTGELVIEKGRRNDVVFRYACRLRGMGVGRGAILAATAGLNRDQVFPPLLDRELEALVDSAMKYTPGDALAASKMKKIPPPPPPGKSVRKRSITSKSPVSAMELCAQPFQPIKFVIPGLLVPGLARLAAPPKVGKTNLALAMAKAVATGGSVLGRDVEHPGAVVYFNEMSTRTLTRRLHNMRMGEVENLLFLPIVQYNLGEGMGDVVEVLESVQDLRLVVFDTYAQMMPEAKHRGNAYEISTAAFLPLRELAEQFPDVCFLLIHHTKKPSRGDSGESYDAAVGSRAESGQMDLLLTLTRKNGDAFDFAVVGRDFEDYTARLRKSGLEWTDMGEVEEVEREAAFGEILQAIRAGNTTPRAIKAFCPDMHRATIHRHLAKLMLDGVVQHVGEDYLLKE